MIIIIPPVIHLNPDVYAEPLAFNPWRWEVINFSFDLYISKLFFFFFFLNKKKRKKKNRFCIDPFIFICGKQGKELHAGSKTFMAFGGGVRLCVGADFAKLQMAIFIHYLVTQYRYI
jgi:cytochrome P450